MKGSSARDEFLALADVAEKAIAEIQELIIRLLKDKVGAEKAMEIAKILTEGRYTHDYTITAEEIKQLGLNMNTNIPPEVYELMNLYPQALQYRPGIEYLPKPYPLGREERR